MSEGCEVEQIIAMEVVLLFWTERKTVGLVIRQW